MGTLNDWTAIDANNNAAPPDGWPENTMAYSQVNNTGRAVQGTMKRYFADNNGSLIGAGVADAYAVTLNESGYAAYFNGLTFRASIPVTNLTTTPTIDVNGIGVVNIVDSVGNALGIGALVAGGIYNFQFDGGNVRVGGGSGLFLPLSGGTISGVLAVEGDLNLGTAGVDYNLVHAAANASVTLSGGSTNALGGALVVFGESHGSQANDFQLVAADQVVAFWNESAGVFDIFTGAGAKTFAARFNSNLNLQLQAGLRFTERTDHVETPTGTFGELWLRNDTPNKLIFTNDAGTDIDLTAGFGSSGLSVVTENTAARTAAVGEFILADDDAAAGVITITLPAIHSSGEQIAVKKIGITADVIVDGNGAQTIDEALIFTLITQYDSILLISDGTNWWVY